MIEFNVLGPLMLRRDGARQPVPTPMLRRILAILLARAGSPVSMDVIIDELWQGAPPPSARRTVSAYVSRLRAVLGDDDRVEATDGAYALQPGRDELDADRFRHRLAAAEAAVRDGDSSAAARLFREAITLWYGPAFEGYTGLSTVDAAANQLEQQRLTAFEQLVEIELDAGRTSDLVVELDAMILIHPYRERLRALRMRALYRSGRQAEALQTYRETHKLLADQLGIEPTDELNQLHRQILAGNLDARPNGASEPVAKAPSQLPPMARVFVGRADEVRRLDEVLEHVTAGSATIPIVSLFGMPGVGKTTLALHWAYRIRDRYPDGDLYLDLRGNVAGQPPAVATTLGKVLRSLGVRADRIPDDEDAAASLYRSLVSRRRMVIVLDNAGSTEQVRHLLPGGASCVVIVTSRQRLGDLEIRYGAYGRRIDVLPVDEAEQLISELIGIEPARAEPLVVAEVARLCAYLPLALRIASARLGERVDHGIAWYRDELNSDDRLSALSLGGDEGVAVRAAFDLSYRHIAPDTQRVFRLLGLFPGPDFGADATAVLADVSLATARQMLAQLAGVHLIRRAATDRYDFHDLIREFAQELAAAEPDRSASLHRLYDWYAGSAHAATLLLYGGYGYLSPAPGDLVVTFAGGERARTWFQREAPGLIAAASAGVANGNPRFASRIADSLRPYLTGWASLADSLLIADAATEAAHQTGDPAAHASAELNRASAYGTRNDYDRAARHLTAALELSNRAGWERGALAAQGNLAMIAGISGRLDDAHAGFLEVIRISDHLGMTLAKAAAVCNLGLVLFSMGRLAEALSTLESGASSIERLGIMPAVQVKDLMDVTAVVLHRLGRLDEARHQLKSAIELSDTYGSPVSSAIIRAHLAMVARDQGRLVEAQELADRALADVQNRNVERIESEILNVTASLYLINKNPQAAIACAEQAYTLARKVGARWPEVEALLGLGNAHFALGDGDGARNYLRDARSLAAEFGYAGLVDDANESLARIGD